MGNTYTLLISTLVLLFALSAFGQIPDNEIMQVRANKEQQFMNIFEGEANISWHESQKVMSSISGTVSLGYQIPTLTITIIIS